MVINIIKEFLKKAKAEHTKSKLTKFLSIAINTRLSFTQKYYKLITQNLFYATIVVLNPTQKWHYFNAKLTENEKQVKIASDKDIL